MDVIVAFAPAAINATRNAKATVSVVALDLESDPVAAGFVATLARPAGNITGIFLDQAELSQKWLELLKDTIPRIARVAVLWDTAHPSPQLSAIEVAARALAVKLQLLEVRSAADLETAFGAAARGRAQGVVILSSPFVIRHRERIAELAAGRRLPTISLFREVAVAGGLMAYGPSLGDGFRRLASFVDRVVKGAKAGRHSRRAICAFRARRQPQDGEAARSDNPPINHHPGGPHHRVARASSQTNRDAVGCRCHPSPRAFRPCLPSLSYRRCPGVGCFPHAPVTAGGLKRKGRAGTLGNRRSPVHAAQEVDR